MSALIIKSIDAEGDGDAANGGTVAIGGESGAAAVQWEWQDLLSGGGAWVAFAPALQTVLEREGNRRRASGTL